MAWDQLFAWEGFAALLLAALAWFADRRRVRRTDLDRVGWVPWTGLFFFALMGAVLLFALAISGQFAG